MPKRYDDEILKQNFGSKTVERIREEIEEQKRRFLETPIISKDTQEKFKEFSQDVIEDWRELIGRCG